MEKKLNNNKGFTLVEIIIAITLIGLVATITGSMINFSFKAEKRLESEYEIQSEVRLATEVINNAIRNTSVTFLMNSKMPDTKAADWNYIGLSSDGSKVIQYTWNGTQKKHDEKTLLHAKDGLKYNLEFSNIEKTKLIDYTIGVQPQNGMKFDVSSSLAAANSLAIDYVKDNKNPASVLAYRLDERPKAGKDSKGAVVISMVLDNSGSMDKNLSNGTSGRSRNNILQEKAKALIDSFPDNVNLGIFSYATDANNAGGSQFIKLVDTSAKTKAKKKIPTRPEGGTNTGDALRRSYYQLKGYTKQLNEEPLYYTILLTDGNPTYHTSTSKNENNQNKPENYKMNDGNVDEDYIGGKGSSDPDNYSLNYAKAVGQNLMVGGDLKIKTFVIGFSAVKSDISKAKEIALSANGSGTEVEDVYFEAGSEAELGIIFDAIREAILTEYWHIYGPYGKPSN